MIEFLALVILMSAMDGGSKQPPTPTSNWQASIAFFGGCLLWVLILGMSLGIVGLAVYGFIQLLT